MTGVRRGRLDAHARTVCRSVVPLLLLTSVVAGARLHGSEPEQPTAPKAIGERKLPRTIKETARPVSYDEPELPGEEGESPARKSLTGNDEIVEISEALADVVIEGNTTIAESEIAQRIKTRPGRLPDPQQVKEDVRALYATRWFFRIENEVRQTPEGPVLVFKVLERPIVKHVEFKGIEGSWIPGSKKREIKHLEELTGLKTGSGFDVGTNQEACRRIESYYQEKGFVYAKVTLETGESPDDREVIFVVDKGPKVHVDSVVYAGNEFFSAGELRTQLKTKRRFFRLFGGKYDPATLPEDVSALKAYYHSVGFFDVKVGQEISQSKDRSSVKIEYQITEGKRYRVNRIELDGNRVIATEALAKDMKLKEHEFFNERFLTADVEKMVNQYGELGRIFATVTPTPKFSEEEGTLDLVFQIDEDRPWRIGRIRVHIQGDHPHTKETVVLNRLTFRTGDLANRQAIKRSEQRLAGSQVFAGAQPGSPDRPQIVVAPPDPSTLNSKPPVRLARGQDDDSAKARKTEPAPPRRMTPPKTPRPRRKAEERQTTRLFHTLHDEDAEVIRGQSPEFDASPEGDYLGGAPLGGEPLQYDSEVPGYLDTDVFVRDTQTGRLNVGVAVNSNQGLVGTFVLEENNFDLFRPPTSFADIVNGTAWRGGAQQFRLEAIPGTELSRYLMSWRDPYFLDQNISLGTSAFYYKRFFPNWTEQRLGGRISVGQQWTPEWSGSVALRLEDVNITNPSVPTPPLLEEALGHSFLSTARASVVHDTRDSPFLAGRGHYLELSYEQGFGEWVFPKIQLDGKQYFTLYERPTGGHRQILSLTSSVGWTGDGTPIFERFFAGGFQSFRGFAFYGVTPRDLGVRIGGQFQALGSAEYLLPITADDMIQVVGFTDFGTVDNTVTLDEFRLTVGGGLRLTIPAMGPAPIALDFGVPIMKQDFDNQQIFAFYLGVQR